MGPDYCRKCQQIDAPCSRGVADAKGRRCPRFEHACRTVEGARVWDAVQRSSGWTGGGMTPRRVDRGAVRARLSDVSAWIVETLLDAFEPAALKAAALVEKRRRPGGDKPGSSAEGEDHD